MRLPQGLDLLIFDCDGVLVDSEILSMRAYQSLFAELGAAPADEIWAQCVGHTRADIFTIIEKAVARVAPEELRDELWPRTKKLFAKELKPTPGVVEFLEGLEGPRCVASSSAPERIHYSLECAGLLKFFDGHLYSARYVQRGKPWPDIFYYAAEKMGVAPETALVIEDSTPGVIAARAAGAKVIGYLGGAHIPANHGERLIQAGAQAVAASWREVAGLLAKPLAI
jgi:HAD superfamily hydrolase (TIGR01509 family)